VLTMITIVEKLCQFSSDMMQSFDIEYFPQLKLKCTLPKTLFFWKHASLICIITFPDAINQWWNSFFLIYTPWLDFYVVLGMCLVFLIWKRCMISIDEIIAVNISTGLSYIVGTFCLFFCTWLLWLSIQLYIICSLFPHFVID